MPTENRTGYRCNVCGYVSAIASCGLPGCDGETVELVQIVTLRRPPSGNLIPWMDPPPSSMVLPDITLEDLQSDMAMSRPIVDSIARRLLREGITTMMNPRRESATAAAPTDATFMGMPIVVNSEVPENTVFAINGALSIHPGTFARLRLALQDTNMSVMRLNELLAQAANSVDSLGLKCPTEYIPPPPLELHEKYKTKNIKPASKRLAPRRKINRTK